MTTTTLPPILPSVIDLVHQAGIWLAAEFSRPTGPRFSDTDTAPIDTEIELFLRERLTALLPARFVGEEAGVLAAEANGYCWVVDPHDGTRAFLEGKRGSAISVGLLRHGIPVLGVVHAPTCPDRGSDMIAWAEGSPITRNGLPVHIDLRQRDLTPADVVFLNHGAGQRPVWNTGACAPARFMPLPSIAYRLARVAVGDGIATVTLRPVNAHDITAGHALLMAAGGILVAEDGVPVSYHEDGTSRPFACFGGAPKAVAALRKRQWRGSSEPRQEPRITLTWPRVAECQRFDRALGCMLGLLAGDSLFDPTLPGQPTDAAEHALTLARVLARTREWNPNAIAASDERCRNGQNPGFLMRAAPIAVWAIDPDQAARCAASDPALAHATPTTQAASAALSTAFSAALLGADRHGMIEAALRTADSASALGAPVATALRQAAAGVAPAYDENQMDHVLIALQNAFFHLAAGSAIEPAMTGTLRRAGDIHANAAITAALVGAADGRTTFPMRWIMPVLTCRPHPDLHPVRPRPAEYWPDDLLDLTEALLLQHNR